MGPVLVSAEFTLGLYLALVVLSRGQVIMGVGFGLLAVLSLVPLRSEPYSNRELAYFFVAIVLALVCAIDIGNLALAGVLVAGILLATWAVDHPRLSASSCSVRITLDHVETGPRLVPALEARLGAPVLSAQVVEV